MKEIEESIIEVIDALIPYDAIKANPDLPEKIYQALLDEGYINLK